MRAHARTPRIPLLGALACLAGLVTTGVLAYLVPLAHVRDAVALQGFTALNRPRLTPFIAQIAHLADPVPYALIGLGLAGVALARRRPRVAAAIVALLVLTGWTTQTLKPLLASPRYDEWLGTGQIAAASWPSGHATAAMTLALCAILAVPGRARPTVAAVGAAFAVSVSYAILALGWHFPSDVLGGFLVATTWTSLAVAVLVGLEQRHPSGLRREVALRPLDALPALALSVAVGALVVGVGLARPEEVARFAAGNATFVAGAAVIAALAVALVLGLARGVRSS
jgi:membrane-associated phospholipid phosphatase